MANSTNNERRFDYRVNMALALCAGCIDRFQRVMLDEFPILRESSAGGVEVDIENPYANSAGADGRLKVLNGSIFQGVDAYMAQTDPMNDGDQLHSTFRGVAALILKNFNIGESSELRPISAVVTRIKTWGNSTAFPETWYPEKAEISSVATWDYQIVAQDANGDPDSAPDEWISTGIMPFGTEDTVAFPKPVITEWPEESAIWVRAFLEFGQSIQVVAERYCAVWIRGLAFEAPWGSVDASAWQLVATLEGTLDSAFIPYLSPYGYRRYELRAIARDTTVAGTDGTYLDINLGEWPNANPAHIIMECLINPNWGLGYSMAEIDEESFIAAADTLHAEAFGLSFLWNDSDQSINDFLSDVTRHIDAALFVDNSTGLFRLKLIRDDYDANELPVLSKDNIEKIDDWGQPTAHELVNAITVHYWDNATDKINSVVMQDITMADNFRNAIEITYEGITHPDLATRVAQRDLQALSTPLISCTIYATRAAATLQVGDCFKLTWSEFGMDGAVMRVIEMGYGDGINNRVRIRAVQDVFTLPTKTFIAPPIYVPVAWPDSVDKWEVFETPYFELCAQFRAHIADSGLAYKPDLARASVIAKRPYGPAVNAIAFVGTQNVGSLEFCTTQTLVGEVGPTDTVWPVTGLSVADTQWVQIGEEIAEIVGMDYGNGELHVRRGLFDTVPQTHAANSVIYYWQNGNITPVGIAFNAGRTSLAALLPGEFEQNNEIDVRLVPAAAGGGEISIVGINPRSITMEARAIRPYPPANVQVCGEYYPQEIAHDADLVLTWNHRNRKNLNFVHWFADTDDGPEPGTSYIVRIYDDEDALIVEEPVDGQTFTLTTSEEITLSGGLNDYLTIEIVSVREEWESWRAYAHTVTREETP